MSGCNLLSVVLTADRDEPHLEFHTLNGLTVPGRLLLFRDGL